MAAIGLPHTMVQTQHGISTFISTLCTYTMSVDTLDYPCVSSKINDCARKNAIIIILDLYSNNIEHQYFQYKTEKPIRGRGMIVAPSSFKLIPIRFYPVQHFCNKAKNSSLPNPPVNRFAH